MSIARILVDERGAPLLDRVRPGWFREVDTPGSRSIIAVLYGDFWKGIDELKLEYAPIDYGFDDGIATIEELRIAWEEAIRERRTKALPSVFD